MHAAIATPFTVASAKFDIDNSVTVGGYYYFDCSVKDIAGNVATQAWDFYINENPTLIGSAASLVETSLTDSWGLDIVGTY